MSEILIVGFPKSGNTWLSRLLSEALAWPVRGIEDARPLAECGEDRQDGCVIRQLHLYPDACGDKHGAIASRYTLNVDKVNGQHKIVHIMRDPRDVTVAISHYWGLNNIQRTITEVMANGQFPLWGCGWSKYVAAWHDASVPVLETRYEWLHDDTQLELQRILDRLHLRAVKPLGEVIAHQAIDVKREEIRNDPDEHYAHGKGAQLTNLRGGRVGDWRTEFDDENLITFADLFTLELLKYGYEDDPAWHTVGVQTC